MNDKYVVTDEEGFAYALSLLLGGTILQGSSRAGVFPDDRDGMAEALLARMVGLDEFEEAIGPLCDCGCGQPLNMLP